MLEYKFFKSKRKSWLVVKLKAIKYYIKLLCYLSSYLNLLMSDLWKDLDFRTRPLD